MNDRGMIKWQPFNSIINNKEIIKSIINDKSKVSTPSKSEEQMEELESIIINSYYLKNKVVISYIENGHIFNIESKIKKIDQIYKMIYLDKKKLFFKQIISIHEQ